MQSKGLLSLIMVVAIGTVRVSASHSIDLDGTNAMEELALVMDAAQEFTAKAMGGGKHLHIREHSNNIIMLHACHRKPRLHASPILEMLPIYLNSAHDSFNFWGKNLLSVFIYHLFCIWSAIVYSPSKVVLISSFPANI